SVANINGYVSFDITRDINFRSTFGYDVTSGRENVFNDTITSVSKLNGSNQPIASIKTTLSEILNNSNIITFSTAKINSPFTVHNKINFMIGQEIYQTRSQSNFLESHLFPVGITPELAFGSMALGTPQIPTSSDVTSKLLSYFTRLNYSYDDKYLLTLTMRRDGSSKFAPEHRWGNFPSAAFAWRISNEAFMDEIKGTVSDLKLRLSTGVAGNNRINDFLYLSQFEAYPFYEASGSQVTGYGPKRDNGNLVLPNSNLQWERTSTRNIGVDVGLFSNRIQFSVDVYSNNVNKLLLAKMVPSTSGYASQSQNVGKTSNKGIEFQVSGTPISSGKLQWTVNFNLSHNVNKVVSLAGQSSFLAFSGWGGTAAPADYIVKEGQPVGLMWGLVTDGFYKVEDFDYANGVYTLKNGVPNDKSITALDPKPGVIKFKDRTDDGLVDDRDRTVIGHSAPKFFGGLNNQFTYGNFDLSVFVNFQYGNQILNANKLEFTSGYTPNSNMLTIMNQRWRNVDGEGQVVTDPQALQALNANAKIWSPLTSASSFYPHSWAVEDGSFLRINNVTLGYNIPASLLSKARISKLRFYTTVNNLAVFSHYSGYDPEVNTRTATSLTPGVDYAAYPRSHTYIFGLNLTF
ncbi:MAG TPA: SusC/RagA family TonB-linked outer membrane protein, partial [Cyclobacteriaceae bacterium]|nr:SusC/RagA family TonB-linked outer membrane protein [Cyclobacteriaceae bacterium]